MLQLHSKAIIHRDLKSPNLLVDKHWRVKIGDFNLSRVEDTQEKTTSITANNPRWLAPEVISQQVQLLHWPPRLFSTSDDSVADVDSVGSPIQDNF